MRSELAGLTVFGVEVFPGVPLRFLSALADLVSAYLDPRIRIQ